MSEKSKDILRKFQLMFFDVILLYKNFLHWNISKSIIGASTMLLGFLFALPFLIVLGVLMAIDPITWGTIIANLVSGSGQSVGLDVLSELLIHPFYVVWEFIIFLGAVIAFVIGSNYSMVLKANLYISYTEWKQIPYLKNLYFSKSIILQYVKVFLRSMVYVAIPVGIFLLVFLILYSLYFTDILAFYTVSYMTFWFFVLAFLAFLYISYRVTFVYMILLEKKNISTGNPKDIVSTSLKITRGIIVLPFIFLVLLFGLVLTPFNLVETSIDTKANEARQYLSYKSWQTPLLSEDQKLDFQILEDKYQGSTDNEVVQEIVVAGRMKLIYVLFAFLVIEWVFGMMLVSFYHHFLLQETEKKSLLWKLKKALLGAGKKKV